MLPTNTLEVEVADEQGTFESSGDGRRGPEEQAMCFAGERQSWLPHGTAWLTGYESSSLRLS